MSCYRRIKTLFTIDFNIFFYIIWVTISYMILNVNITYWMLIDSLCTVFLMQYINYKSKNKFIAIGASMAMGVVGLILINRNPFFIVFNGIYIFFLNVACFKLEEEYIDYFMGSQAFKKSLIFLICLWLLNMLFGNNINKSFFRFYIIYLVIGIVFLRQIRDYSYNLVNKKSIKIDAIVSVLVFSLSIDKVFNGFIFIIKILKKLLEHIVGKLIDGIVYIINKPFTECFNFFKRIFSRSNIWNKLKIEMLREKPKKIKPYTPNKHYLQDLAWLKHVFIGFILVIICMIVFKLIKSFMYSMINIKNDNVIKEEKEKINDKEHKKKKRLGLASLFNSIYALKDVRNKIRYTYRKLEKLSKDKELYDNYMTAKQLENSIKVNTDVVDNEINGITNIYNEAKFSNHSIEEEKAEKIKEDFNIIKDKI